MEFVSFLAGVSLRSLALAAAAWAAMAIFRVKSPAARHAVWTAVTAGMLVVAVASDVLPAIPVRIVPRAPRPAEAALEAPFHLQVASTQPPSTPAPPPRPFPWSIVYAAGLFACTTRLAYGYRLTRKLVRTAKPLDPGLHESACISVPLTVGWLRPKILLPTGWDAWEPEKLQAVLVHERIHVRRADWAVAVLAGVNRCVFWFHPLAWWLDARLKGLAEQACDDASLPHVASRECYAQVLLEMAAAIRPGSGRVGWEAMAMARGMEVKMRVERILDESRQIFPAMTRGRWLAVAACAAPLIYLAAVARPAHLRAQDPPPPQVQTQQTGDVNSVNRQLEASRAELARLEAQIAQFKRENMGRLPEQMQTNLSQLNAYQAQLVSAHEALAHLQQERLMQETQLQNLRAQQHYYESQDAGGEKARAFDIRIRDLRLQLEAQSRLYTQQHPDIQRLKSEIAAVERERSNELPADRQAQKLLLDLNASMAQLRTQIQGTDLNQAQKRNQVQDLNRLITQYQQRIEIMPELEMRYAELMRNYDAARLQQAQLANRPTSGPRLISRRDPEYTDEARKARLQGKVELSVTVGADGVPGDIQVTHGLGAGLDQKAIDCVKAWRFQPASRNGEPVPAFVIVEVPFRLL